MDERMKTKEICLKVTCVDLLPRIKFTIELQWITDTNYPTIRNALFHPSNERKKTKLIKEENKERKMEKNENKGNLPQGHMFGSSMKD